MDCETKKERYTQCYNLCRPTELLAPFEEKAKGLVPLNDYVLRNELATGELYSFYHAIQTAVQATADKIERNALYDFRGSNPTFKSKKDFRYAFTKQMEKIFINVVGDCGLPSYMISKHTDEIIEIRPKNPGNYLLCFNILDGSRNLQDHLPMGTVFGLYKLNSEGDLDLQGITGNNLVGAGLALYTTCTRLNLAFKDGKGAHCFYLDQSLGEFTLDSLYAQIPRRGISYSLNEGITIGWDDATKIFVNQKKDPRFKDRTDSFFLGSVVADIFRIIKTGGIYMNPANVKYPNGKLSLLYESIPIAYILRQAGGYASDGWVSILDLEVNGPHDKSPFFGGSIENVISIMELKNVYKARNQNK